MVPVLDHFGGGAHAFLPGNGAVGELDPLRVALGLALEGGVKVEAWHARANAQATPMVASARQEHAWSATRGPAAGALGVGTGLLRREPLEAREHRLQRPLEVQPAEPGQRREIGRAQERRRRAAAHDRDQRLAATAEALLVDVVAPEQVEIEDAAAAAGLDRVREGDHAGAEALEIRLVAAGEEIGAVVGDADQVAGDERVALGERGAMAELGRNGAEAVELDLVDAVAAALSLDFRPIERHDAAQEG